jgi:hypothetical protein
MTEPAGLFSSEVSAVQTELTPELATQLLAKAHPDQRRQARPTVDEYFRAIRDGRWRLVPDPILVDPDGRMFNGGHRCAAVIRAGIAIPVFIGWDADPTLFDVIDGARVRSAYQFVHRTYAKTRAGAARVTLWYEHRFDRELQPSAMKFAMSEVLEEIARREASFDANVALASLIYEITGLSLSVVLAAFALASELGHGVSVETFVEGIREPWALDADEPARLIADRFRRHIHRNRRRSQKDDWMVLVRALNLHIEHRRAAKLVIGECWPRIAEPEVEFNRRRNRLSRDGAS